MKKKWKIVLIIVVILIVAVILFFALIPDSIKIEPEHKICETDEDCVHVATHCSCHCGDAVNKKYLKIYENKAGLLCLGYTGKMCSMICNKEVICKNNRCEYFGEYDSCNLNSDCEVINCSDYEQPGLLEGFKPYCVEDKCRCECRGCE